MYSAKARGLSAILISDHIQQAPKQCSLQYESCQNAIVVGSGRSIAGSVAPLNLPLVASYQFASVVTDQHS